MATVNQRKMVEERIAKKIGLDIDYSINHTFKLGCEDCRAEKSFPHNHSEGNPIMFDFGKAYGSFLTMDGELSEVRCRELLFEQAYKTIRGKPRVFRDGFLFRWGIGVSRRHPALREIGWAAIPIRDGHS